MGLFDRIGALFRKTSPEGIHIPREAAARAAPLLKELEVRLREAAREPGLEGFGDGGTLPRAFPDAIHAIYEAYDAFAAELMDAAGLDVTCARGCTWCCNEVPTPVRGFELLEIYHQVQPRKGYRKVHDRCAELAGRFTEELERTSGGRASVKSDGEAFIAARMAYLRAGEPCAFLDRQLRTCTVYDVRPLACRMHFSLDEPLGCDPADSREPRTPNLAPPEPLVDLMRDIDARLGLSVSPMLPQGFAELGAVVMRGEPIRWETP